MFPFDVIVTSARPWVQGPFTADPITCEHGVAWYVEPTGEQFASWVKERSEEKRNG